MANLQGLLASLLNSNPGAGGLLSDAGYLQSTGLGPQQMQRYQAGVGAAPAMPPPPPALGQGTGARRELGLGQPDQTQTASTRSSGGIGDFLGNLLMPKAAQKNKTVQLLMQDGLDEGTATLYAGNKQALQQYLMQRTQPQKRDTVVVDGKLVDAQSGQVIGDYGDPDDPTADWSKLDDGRLFNQRTGETRDVGQPGGGGAFSGTSVEAQSLNHLIKTGQLTPDQAAQLGAGKTITNPADGSITFLTPQGVFGMPANGGQPQPLTPQPGGSGGAPVDGTSVRPGIIPLTEGKPGKLATEGERRNRSLYTVVQPELKVVEDNWASLTDINNQAASRLPLSEFVTTPEYQRASTSLQTIIASYLYSVSGATATPEEVMKQTNMLLPRPGEAPTSVADKLSRIRTMVNAIKMAGGETERAPQQGGSQIPPTGRDRKARQPVVIDGYTIEEVE